MPTLWKMPQHYFGATWPGYYVGPARNRDSDTLENSNFEVALSLLEPLETPEGVDGERDVQVVRERHCLVGWVEWIAVHQDNEKAVQELARIEEKLEAYPILDEEHFSEMEMEEANEVWGACYNDSDRLEWIREHQNECEFQTKRDIWLAVRGYYFPGHPSTLLN